MTHMKRLCPHCDAANSNCSTDSLAQGPLGMLWFTDLNFQMPSRHGRGRARISSRPRDPPRGAATS